MNLQRSDDSAPVLAPPAAMNNALHPGTRLAEFEIIQVIGQGGFGIVYLAKDHSLDREVALKEYMPAAFAGRQNNTQVTMLSEHYAETFEVGLHSFVNEAQMLAKFDHPGLVKVYRFWEANGTAYMAMPLYNAPTLKQILKEDRARVATEAWLRNLLHRMLDALQVLHEKQCYHRDIAPDNILMLEGEQPLLLDFGAARRVIGDMTRALTVILKPGYAPIEQYGDVPNMVQGPWTDLYALASVIYFIITDKVPVPALSRLVYDSMEPLSTAESGRYSPEFLKAIDAALAVRPENRPQNVAEFRALLGMVPAPQPATPAAVGSGAPAKLPAAPNPKGGTQPARPPRKKALLFGGAGLVACAAAGAAWLTFGPALKPAAPAPATTAVSAASEAVQGAAPAPESTMCPLQLPDGSSGCPVMVAVPAGTYRVGSVAGDAGAMPEEMGGAPIEIAAFEMSAHEITAGQWQLCVAAGACPAPPKGSGGEPNPKLPVVNVSWDAATGYIEWLSKKTGRNYRMPSEAEWEYAARGGAKTTFPWGDKIGQDNAQCGQCGSHLDYRQPAPPGSYKAYKGLYDMVGNVYEWVNDCWYPSHADAAKAKSAPPGAECKNKVQKSGAFDSMETDVRPAARTFGERTGADPRVGFRVSR